MKQLAKIQQQLKAPKSQYNKFGNYKYRSCEDILEAVKPLLGECTLTLSDEVKEIGSIPYVEANATLKSSDGEITVFAQAGINPNRKGMDIAQSFGSSSSYARKYALAGLFLLDDTKDADTQDNTEENKPPTKKRIEEMEKELAEAYKEGASALNDKFFSLTPVEQESVREYANVLKFGSSQG